MTISRETAEALTNGDIRPQDAVQLQEELAGRVRFTPLPADGRLIAGADVAVLKKQNELLAGVVVWDLRTGRVVEQAMARAQAAFPYVPGLLSFREAPVACEAFASLRRQPDVAMFDGQGYAHPRRCGLASHMGVLLDLPSIGCAKSRLIGEHADPEAERGSWTELTDRGEVIGAVLRTRTGVRPMYVSVGHRADLATALQLVLRCATRYRLPEPTRLAHQLVTATKATLPPAC